MLTLVPRVCRCACHARRAAWYTDGTFGSEPGRDGHARRRAMLAGSGDAVEMCIRTHVCRYVIAAQLADHFCSCVDMAPLNIGRVVYERRAPAEDETLR